VLETERLILRPVRMADAPAIQRRFAQWDVVRWLHATVPWPYPDDGAEEHLRRCLDEEAKGAKSHWAITLKGAQDDCLGLIDLWPYDGETRDNRGFWLDPEYWGRGLMTEAAERVTEYAFETLGWTELYLNNAEGNAGSHRIKEKQGAVIVDRSPHAYVGGEAMRVTWRLTREAWRARRQGSS
jgi:RimJ/RimL family protein N-acetyltransferase